MNKHSPHVSQHLTSEFQVMPPSHTYKPNVVASHSRGSTQMGRTLRVRAIAKNLTYCVLTVVASGRLYFPDVFYLFLFPNDCCRCTKKVLKWQVTYCQHLQNKPVMHVHSVGERECLCTDLFTESYAVRPEPFFVAFWPTSLAGVLGMLSFWALAQIFF